MRRPVVTLLGVFFICLALLGVAIARPSRDTTPAWLLVERTQIVEEPPSYKVVTDQDLARFPELKCAMSQADEYHSKDIQSSGLAEASNTQGRDLIESLGATKLVDSPPTFVSVITYQERSYRVWIEFSKDPPARL